MKILMFGWEYPPFITGGLGTACYGLSQSLAYLIEKITFVLPKIKGLSQGGLVNLLDASNFATNSKSDTIHENIDVIAIESTLQPYITAEEYSRQIKLHARNPTGKNILTPLSGDYSENLFSEVFRYTEVAAQIATLDQYDVIHAHDWMTFLAGIKAKQLTGLPLVVHVHALESDRAGESINHQVVEIERLGIEQADRIIAVSQRTKELIISKYGTPSEKIVVIHNGVKPLAANQPIRTKNLLPEKLVVFLGRITLQKGPEYFLEAAYLVTRAIKNVRFAMAGHGDMLPQMILRMAELRMTERFHFTGFLDETNRNKLFSMADLFVMTSVSEPFGISPLEALQHDIPVIVSKQSGVSEVLNHVIKVDFWDVRKIADSIIQVLSQESLREEMIKGSRTDLQALSWEISAHRLVDIYKELTVS